MGGSTPWTPGPGGYPFNPRVLLGNGATAGIVYMLNGVGVKTNGNLEKLMSAGDFYLGAFGKDNKFKDHSCIQYGKQSLVRSVLPITDLNYALLSRINGR
ncbi:hypothetical protein SLA2020_149500 [Shorea laevis]